MPRALLLTGLVGSGKTSVAIALGELLAERGEAYAIVDLDWLGWCRVPRGTPAELIAANLRAVWGNYRAAGVERLVLTRYVRGEEELQPLRDTLEGLRLTVVRLDVPRSVLERRIRRRDEGAELAEHLELIAAAGDETEPADIVVRGDLRTPRAVALDVLSRWG